MVPTIDFVPSIVLSNKIVPNQVYPGRLETSRCKDNPFLEYDSIEVSLETDHQ